MMPGNNLDFTCAVVTGGGGGIGKAISQWLVNQGKKVIIVGRTESTLKDSANEIGATGYYVLDTGDIPAIEPFVKKVLKAHPEVDCLINNAGVQRPLDVNNFDLQKADQEIAINISGPMHLAIEMLDHLKSKPSATIINVGSVLGYNPFSIINPVYNGTKAFVHFWTMNLRTQLKGSNISVIEVAPPTVATDLHREREDPDDNKKEKNKNALSLDEFIEFFARGMKENKDTIAAGMAIDVVDKWYAAYGEAYAQAGDAYEPK
ncbi:NAD(P)-binding protein [Cystobasidium minutum MCA 4210]|uniref:NAD(P)-binding protein n=1 Tax=Cystobasidium minutum MCA 4210 TaxID=1397322 RepID=UPI0034CF0223|eukprot:jgi/Rhomi1/163761/estExt_Genewise1Plus.C_80397